MATVLEQVSCENASESTWFAAFASPLRTLLGLSVNETVFVYAWIFIIGLWLLLYFAAPLSSLNSSNGFRSGRQTTIVTVIVFVLVLVAYVLWTRDSACRVKKIKALYYVAGRKPSMPAYLEKAVNRVAAKPENIGRFESSWSE
jgi:hypothetical protein